MSHFIGSNRPYLDGPREALLQLVAVFPYTDTGGHGCCYHFEDEQGRRIVWFSRKSHNLEAGQRVCARFVVKSHTEYNGTKQNITKQFRILEKCECAREDLRPAHNGLDMKLTNH